MSIVRSCNDQGALYGSVTQRDISDALIEAGFGVDARAVRMSHPIRRIGSYPIPIQFDRDLSAEVTLMVKTDRELEGFTELGEPIEVPEAPQDARRDEHPHGYVPAFDEDHDDDDDRSRKRRRRGRD